MVLDTLSLDNAVINEEEINVQDYLFFTDDSCDLPLSYYEQHNINVVYLGFVMDGQAYTAKDMPAAEFYGHLRAGKMPTTTQISVEQWLTYFEPYLARGKDILYIAFSSGLSGTCSSAQVAARELSEKYPGRKIRIVDSLCASLGQGLLVHKANQLRESGASMDHIASWVEENKLHVSHMVAVDDLMHLHRGGRVSKTSAVAGSLLGIKPIIHMNNEGKLIPIDKIRGRKQSLNAIVDKTEKLIGSTPNDYFMVCHSDCLEEATDVAKLASKRFGIKDYLINDIGPVIGSHTGPGTIALFVMAEHR